VADWHGLIGHATYADAILDRLVHNAHRIALSGDSLRKARRALADGPKAGGAKAGGVTP
jgi:DNA replication protein DnaC